MERDFSTLSLGSDLSSPRAATELADGRRLPCLGETGTLLGDAVGAILNKNRFKVKIIVALGNYFKQEVNQTDHKSMPR